VLRRSARKSRMERIKIEYIKDIMEVKGMPDINDIIQKERIRWYGHVKRMPEDRITKLIMELIPKKRTSRKNVDGKSTRSHDNRKFRIRSVDKQGGMAFSFRKTATAVIKPDRSIIL
jgi:hypothetical protein